MSFNPPKRTKRTTTALITLTDTEGNKVGVTYFELSPNNLTHIAMLEKLKSDPDYQFNCNVVLEPTIDMTDNIPFFK